MPGPIHGLTIILIAPLWKDTIIPIYSWGNGITEQNKLSKVTQLIIWETWDSWKDWKCGLHCHQQHTKVLIFSHPHQNLSFFSFANSYDKDVRWYLIVASICISLISDIHVASTSWLLWIMNMGMLISLWNPDFSSFG